MFVRYVYKTSAVYFGMLGDQMKNRERYGLPLNPNIKSRRSLQPSHKVWGMRQCTTAFLTQE